MSMYWRSSPQRMVCSHFLVLGGSAFGNNAKNQCIEAVWDLCAYDASQQAAQRVLRGDGDVL